MKAAIITTIYDDYDTLRPVVPQVSVDVDWVLVTDKQPADSLGWRVVLDPHPGENPYMSSKRAKMFPWNYTDAPQSLYLDASFQIASAWTAIDLLCYAQPIAQFHHSQRDCIYEEGDVSHHLTKYHHLPIPQQLAYYRAQGHLPHWGLWAAGVIARQHTEAVKAFGAAWLADCERWGYQDQISQAPCLSAHGLRPVSFVGHVYQNQWLLYQGSKRHFLGTPPTASWRPKVTST